MLFFAVVLLLAVQRGRQVQEEARRWREGEFDEEPYVNVGRCCGQSTRAFRSSMALNGRRS